MENLLFCNIGWMDRYEGLKGKKAKIIGGGKFVVNNHIGGEVCNFLTADDDMVYGHVETITEKYDRKIQLEAFGGQGNYARNVDVVWTATHPQEKGRRVVGWYRNATVFRERQEFSKPPSKQHARDGLTSFRIQAKSEDVVRLNINERTLTMGRGAGWMGQTPWWTPPENPSDETIQKFLRDVRELIDSKLPRKNVKQKKSIDTLQNSPSTPKDPYTRYVEAYEIEITPQHDELQSTFEAYLKKCGFAEIQPNVASVDLRFRDPKKGLVLAEVKPCDKANVRYAIRTAIGQLLDYRQHAREEVNMMIVVGLKPNEFDKKLAISNGFAVAYPSQRKFQITWPK